MCAAPLWRVSTTTLTSFRCGAVAGASRIGRATRSPGCSLRTSNWLKLHQREGPGRGRWRLASAAACNNAVDTLLQLDEFNRARASGGKGFGKLLSFGRSPKPTAASPGTPENLQLDDLLLFSEDSLPTSLLRHNAENQTRAVKMFASVLQYMGVHGEMLGAMQALELVQKLLHQGLKRAELRDELFMQLVKQTRGNPNASAKAKAWQLFYITAATMPPTKDFMGLVSGGCEREEGWRMGWAGQRQQQGKGGASLTCHAARVAPGLARASLPAAEPALARCLLTLLPTATCACALQSMCTAWPMTRTSQRTCGRWPRRPGTP